MKKYLTPFLIFAVSLGLDAYSKYLVVKSIPLYSYDKLSYLGDFLRIVHTQNTGGVFGMFQGNKMVFLILSSVVLLLMVGYYIYEKNKTNLFNIAMAFIVSGAIGNIIDRLIAGRAGVVDFISVGFGNTRWYAFNIADSAIILGAFLLVVVFYIEEKKRKLEESK